MNIRLTTLLCISAGLFQIELCAQSEVYFERATSPLDIQRVFVIAGDSKPCEGVSLDADGLAEYAEVRLLSAYDVLERDHLDMVLDEQKLGMSGLVYEDQVVEAGCLQGSEGVVFCEIGCLAGQSMIKVKLVDCKESVQQWSAMGLDAKVGDVLDRVLGVSTSVKPPRRQEGPQCGRPIEYNGYEYRTVRIGDQCWFAENLRTEEYNNGDMIPANLSDSEWGSTPSGAVAAYDEAFTETLETPYEVTFGLLYNWYAVDDARGLCPSGWHVPTDGEWTAMMNFLGITSVAWKMKAKLGWAKRGNGSNTSGFSGLPGGYRFNLGSFGGAGSEGYWWSSSMSYPSAWSRFLITSSRDIGRNNDDLRYGFSVRCVRDAE